MKKITLILAVVSLFSCEKDEDLVLSKNEVIDISGIYTATSNFCMVQNQEITIVQLSNSQISVNGIGLSLTSDNTYESFGVVNHKLVNDTLGMIYYEQYSSVTSCNSFFVEK
jgi:hypothetical protein